MVATKFSVNQPGADDIKGVSKIQDGRTRIKGKKIKGISEKGGRYWRNSIADMGDEVLDGNWDGGVIGMSYGKRRSSSIPHVRGVSFSKPGTDDSLQDVSDDAYAQPDVLPKLNGVLNGQANPVYKADETNESLDGEHGRDGDPNKGVRDDDEELNIAHSHENNSYTPDDDTEYVNVGGEDIEMPKQGSPSEANGVSEIDIEGMFDVEDV